MRILNAVYGDSTGGRWNATLKTAELLADKGHELTLLIDPRDLGKVPDFGGRKIDTVTLGNSGHYDLVASWKARRLMREREIDAVIAHSGRAIYMLERAASRTVPVIAFNHSHNIKRTLKADAFFCITPYVKQIVDAATGGTKPAFVISNAVTIPDETDLVSARGAERVFTIGCMARMAPNKGVRTLIEALKILRDADVRFLARIAGDGEERAACEELVRTLGLESAVEFLGWVHDEGKRAFFRSLDVMCFTSEADYQPITILESLAWGKALIGTDIVGPSSCYEHEETALVVPPRDAGALAQALIRLHGDVALLERIAGNARRRAITVHSDEVVADLLDRHLREVARDFVRTAA